MGFPTSKKSAIDRRLKELEKESKLLRGEVRSLSKAVKKPESLAASGRFRPPPPEPRPPRTPERSAGPAHRPERPAGQFNWGPRGPAAPPKPEAAVGSPPAGEPQRNPVEKDKRFANYFSSGGLMGTRPLRQEKNVQRNKAIFMIVLLVIVGLWVASIFL
jgi:hypothetical protein